MGHSKPVSKMFRNLWRSGAPTSIYPFLLPLSKAVQLKKLSDEKAIEVLLAIESFLIRRGVSGLEPTGLHSVFKRLWADCDEKPSKESVIKEISKHKTVAWPRDEEFRNAICKRPLYGVGITHYVLLEYDASLGGDQPKDILGLNTSFQKTLRSNGSNHLRRNSIIRKKIFLRISSRFLNR